MGIIISCAKLYSCRIQFLYFLHLPVFIVEQIQSMMKQNEELPDIEKLNRHEFDLDIDEQARLQAEGEAEVDQVSRARCIIG